MVQQQVSVFSLRSSPAVMEVVLVANRHLLGLVADQTDVPPDLGCHLAFEAALSQQAVDGLEFVPSLGCRHFW